MSFFKKLKKDIEVGDELPSTLAEDNQISTSDKKTKKTAAKNKEEQTRQQENSEGEEGQSSVFQKKKSVSDWLQSKGQLAVDVYQTNSYFCVQAPIAGVDQENIDISIEGEMLVIKGERKEIEDEKEKKYFYKECYWGPFSRQVILPDDVDVQKIKALLKKGVLIIQVPRKQSEKKKVIIQIEE